MKVLVFGAAGNVGVAVVDSALQAGHQVTAFIHQTPLPEHLTDKVRSTVRKRFRRKSRKGLGSVSYTHL
ncbi:MAG: NmrA family NAD(P)-binding protein, partial [Alphaproteobacteria bacterium]|nr:NmrA family NAD(P)-binding protein [Alphaproteobacteria bacterium]